VEFGKRTTAEQATAGVDLRGKTVVITGVNSGLGLESMRVLAARGARVVGLARTQQKADEACAQAGGDCVGMPCELSDFGSVAECAERIRGLGTPVDVLMTNAGIMAPMKLSHAHGVEMQFATNHLGHFILINRLLERLQAAARARVVILSSAAHTFTVKGGIDFGNLDASGGYDPWRFYGQSKLANLLTARALARRLDDGKVSVNAVHPGIIRTNLGRDIGGLFSRLMMLAAPLMEKTLEQGAATQCLVAAHPSLEGSTGGYYSDCKRAGSSRHGKDEALAEALWQRSTELTKNYLD
jgi:WW domain-containing oxidoreductase